ncbi:hypothetical protein [Dictyobacter kobayashii]|uniref:GGDEF domain-containing protein n=1 Tax=Dictyobacter kobayashii TaxID=2014872 RepID=A0A402AJK1_9CHLR|nr:hypothetical protein [Dictyobacter kobayashii]GCE19358.1 hypothetical protein KDK_31580 [Dictyobacter kobayashii]
MVEMISEVELAYIQNNGTALIYIQVEYQAQLALRYVAQRIRSNIRQSDSIILLEATHACIILLPMTPFEGAQAVVQRISALLSHLRYDIQIIYGEAAQSLYNVFEMNGVWHGQL